jgi:hypothetical protein
MTTKTDTQNTEPTAEQRFATSTLPKKDKSATATDVVNWLDLAADVKPAAVLGDVIADGLTVKQLAAALLDLDPDAVIHPKNDKKVDLVRRVLLKVGARKIQREQVAKDAKRIIVVNKTGSKKPKSVLPGSQGLVEDETVQPAPAPAPKCESCGGALVKFCAAFWCLDCDGPLPKLSVEGDIESEHSPECICRDCELQRKLAQSAPPASQKPASSSSKGSSTKRETKAQRAEDASGASSSDASDASIPPAVAAAMAADKTSADAEQQRRAEGKKKPAREPAPSRWPATYQGRALPNPRTCSADEMRQLYTVLTGRRASATAAKSTVTRRIDNWILGRPVNRCPIAVHPQQLDAALDALSGLDGACIARDREEMVMLAVNALLQQHGLTPTMRPATEDEQAAECAEQFKRNFPSK